MLYIVSRLFWLFYVYVGHETGFKIYFFQFNKLESGYIREFTATIGYTGKFSTESAIYKGMKNLVGSRIHEHIFRPASASGEIYCKTTSSDQQRRWELWTHLVEPSSFFSRFF